MGGGKGVETALATLSHWRAGSWYIGIVGAVISGMNHLVEVSSVKEGKQEQTGRLTMAACQIMCCELCLIYEGWAFTLGLGICQRSSSTPSLIKGKLQATRNKDLA